MPQSFKTRSLAHKTCIQRECCAYSRYINKVLHNDDDCRPYLPLDPHGSDLYQAVRDGLVPCKLLNTAFVRAIDERAMNKSLNIAHQGQRAENLQLALTAALANGCAVRDVTINDFVGGSTEIQCNVLEFIYQIIINGFFRQINIYNHPELCSLKRVDEDANDLKCLSPTQLLLRYINAHLHAAGTDKRVVGFDELSDVVIYANILYYIAPMTIRGRLISPGQIINDPDHANRTKGVLQNLRELEADMFLSQTDFQNSIYEKELVGKLNLSTIAYLFTMFPGVLLTPSMSVQPKQSENVDHLVSRNFMNSFNVYPFSTHACVNLRNGLILCQMFEILRNGCTVGLKFTTEFDRERREAQHIHNNTNIVRLVQSYPLHLPHIDSSRITKTDESCCQELLQEIMRTFVANDAYNEADLLAWVNEQLHRAGKHIQLRSFSDRAISDECLFAVVLNNLTNGKARKEFITGKRAENASYYISIAHQHGYPVNTLPEHFAGCSSRYVALAFATLRWPVRVVH